MITNQDIIFISSIEWNFLWQIHQELASRLAKAGNRILYIENTGVRTPNLRDTRRIVARLKNYVAALFSRSVREVSPNIYVISPIVLPPFGSPLRRFLNRRFLLPKIKRIARRLGVRDPLLWTYLPTDTAVDLIEMLRTRRSVAVYYCGADFSQLTPNVAALGESETTLLKQTDVVFTYCSQLVEHCEKWNGNVHTVPAGVDLDLFLSEDGDDETATDAVSPSQENRLLLSSLPRPVIGYVGGMHHFMDYSLLIELASARPLWSWVFVGPVQGTIEGLGQLPNVHILGQQPHQHLAHYIRRFDVCLIPYLNNPATATALPLKLNEYLAVGKPVVSTELPAVSDFNARHQILITAPNDPEAFLRAIEQALHLPNDESSVARRREVAALGDWKSCLQKMSESIETLLHK
jgi:glycosyltransferase involved in cell wall biosynthesis